MPGPMTCKPSKIDETIRIDAQGKRRIDKVSKGLDLRIIPVSRRDDTEIGEDVDDMWDNVPV